MLISYHNHTRWSDGAPTVAAQVEAARLAGLDELGLSDHYVLCPTGLQCDWSMDLDLLGDYVRELREARSLCRGLVLRIGVEADYFPETVTELRDRLQPYPWDFVIGSVHYVDGFPLDSRAADWEGLTQPERDEVWRGYWIRIAEMAKSGLYDFVGHLDLPKKFGYLPQADLTLEWTAALDAIAGANMALEINTAGWWLPAAEQYPSLTLLREARARSIPLLINSDAHVTGNLTRGFAAARRVAEEAGYRTLVRYEQRRRFEYPRE